MGYLADFLFPRERAQSPVRSLSGGERNRLLLARLFAKTANVLVLDEPTNDLDLETLDLLEEAVGDFDGTVLLVSHDRVFLDNVVTSILALEAGEKPIEYVGGWNDYLRQRSQPAQASVSVGDRSPKREASTGARRKLSYNEQRELQSLPEKIETLEDEQRLLRVELESPEFYKSAADRIHTVLRRIEEAGREHDALLARWMELEERQSS
jgi:ATP-binding cassette subfamily F protein uup